MTDDTICDVNGCDDPAVVMLVFETQYCPLSFCNEHYSQALLAQGGKHERDNLDVLLEIEKKKVGDL